MRYPVIKTDSYLLIVSDDKIRMGDYYVDDYFFLRKCVVDDSEYWSNRKEYKKLIAHRPFNNAPYLDGVDVLPPLEDDVKQLAKLKYPIIMSPNGRNLAGGHYDIDVNFSERSAYEHGYKKAREKYKFTEEDMLQAAKYGYEFRDTTSFPEHNFEDSCINNTKQWLKSRQQPKYPIAFVTETYHKKIGKGSIVTTKTTTNSEGRRELVGEWVYE